MITGGDLRQSRLDVGYKTFTISPCSKARLKVTHVKLMLSVINEWPESKLNFIYY